MKLRIELLVGICVFGMSFVSSERGRREFDDVTFNQDIAPTIFRKCAPCHYPGGPAPFSLITYEDVKKRYELVREVALVPTMPPTDALSDLGRIVEEPPLTDDEGMLLQEWGRRGLKEGDPKLLPPTPAFTAGWRMGEPDMVVRPKDQGSIPAEGPLFRRQVVIDIPPGENRRLAGFDVRPMSPGLRYLRLAMIGPTDNKGPFEPTGADTGRLIGSWALGHFAWKLPAGSAVEINPGRKLLAEVQYQPLGKKEDGGFEVALYFAKVNQPRRVQWHTLGTKDFEIKMRQWVELRSEWTLDKDIDLVAIYPEIRLYARQVRILAEPPGGGQINLLTVLSYDRSWPGSYVFDRAVQLKKGTKLVGMIQYDNTEHAYDSKEKGQFPIRFGPGNRDETFWIHLQYVPSNSP